MSNFSSIFFVCCWTIWSLITFNTLQCVFSNDYKLSFISAGSKRVNYCVCMYLISNLWHQGHCAMIYKKIHVFFGWYQSWNLMLSKSKGTTWSMICIPAAVQSDLESSKELLSSGIGSKWDSYLAVCLNNILNTSPFKMVQSFIFPANKNTCTRSSVLHT